MEFAANLTRFWFFIGSPREGMTWLHRALAATTATHPDFTAQQTEQVLTGYAMATWIALWQGQPADTYLAACRTLAGHSPTPPVVLFVEGAHLLLAHADPRAMPLLATARNELAATGTDYHGHTIRIELTEATAAAFTGTRDQALDITQRCLERTQAAGSPSNIIWATVTRAAALQRHDNPDDALTLARQALSQSQATDNRWGLVLGIHTIAWALAQQLADSTNPADAATTIAYLLGGAEHHRRRTGMNLPGLAPHARATTNAQNIARAVLDAATYAQAYQRGRTDSPTTVIAVALGQPGRQPGSPVAQPWDTLTPAQKQVAQLAADGLTNKMIAAHRGVSLRTVETQMTQILRRLDLTNRHQIAAMLPRP